MKKVNKLIIIFVTIILFLAVAIIMLPWNIMFWYGEYVIPDPSKPQITQEKFPFKLIYELNGEKIVIEDIMICKYIGNEWDGESDKKSRIWRMKLKSGSDTIDLWKGYNDKGKKQKIIWGVSPEFYMGDVNDDGEYRKPSKDECLYPGMTQDDFYYHYIELQTMDSNDVPTEEIIDKRRLLKYGIKIISWECRKPIENIFVD